MPVAGADSKSPSMMRSLAPDDALACVTVKLFAATVALPLRCEPEFCVHDTVTEPEPLPLVGETLIHDPLPAADQLPPVQPLGEPVMVTVCEPALDVGFDEVGLMPKLVHVVEPAACVTVKVFEAMVA